MDFDTYSRVTIRCIFYTPVILSEIFLSDRSSIRSRLHERNVRFHHVLDQLSELDSRCPSEISLSFACITLKLLYFCGTIILWIDSNSDNAGMKQNWFRTESRFTNIKNLLIYLDFDPAVVAWIVWLLSFSFSKFLSSGDRWIESRSGNGMWIVQ